MDFLASYFGFGNPTLGGCEAASIAYPSLRGAEFLSVEAHWVTNFTTAAVPGFQPEAAQPAGTTPPVSFCNVTLTHTHPGQHDRLQTRLWLPMGDNVAPWNGRLLGAGGGGYQTGLFDVAHAVGVAQGYAVVGTDGGHTVADLGDPSTWALASEGNVDLYALQNFASVALRDAAVVGRAVTAQFYGRPVKKAYFLGCSTGGRQAAMLAQRFPDSYDGYLAGAPAIYMNEFLIATLRAQVRMGELGYVPPPCELREFTSRAVAACDHLDGVEDGLVSEPELCFDAFDARALAGEEFECAELGKSYKLTAKGADIAQTAWEGWWEEDSHGQKQKVWAGVGHEAVLAGPFHVVNAQCDYATGTPVCKADPYVISWQWVQYFLYKSHSQTLDVAKLTTAELKKLLHQSRQWYDSTIRTADPDLSGLRAAGAKLLLWHGLADPIIPYNQSRRYYDEVAAFDPAHVDEYLRYFEAPGVDHCGLGGGGLFPHSLFQNLHDWVERGKAPGELLAWTPSGADGPGMRRALCKYPLRAKYDGKGDVTKASSFSCR